MQPTKEFVLALQKSPALFFKEILGESCEPYQIKILESIQKYDRVAVSACHSVGKSWTLARVVLWYMSVFPGAKVITTAPTYRQVKDILWAELRSAYAKSKWPLGGRMNQVEWQMTPDGNWFAMGFSPRSERQGEEGQGTQSSFQGFHATHFLLIFDEATGIPFSTWTMAEGLMTGSKGKFIAIGNPTSRNSEFYKCFSSPDWHKIKLSCFDSPNLRDNGIIDLASLEKEIDLIRTLPDAEAFARMQSYKVSKDYLISLKWVVSMAMPRKWGIDHPLFQSKVLGEFPRDSDNAVVPLWAVEDSALRVYYPTDADRRIIGVDVARFGSDSTVLTALHGKRELEVRTLVKADTGNVTGTILAMSASILADIIVVDETGIGGGVVDMLNEAKRNGILNSRIEIRGVQFGAACEDEEDKAKYVNLKARMFGLLRDDMKAADGLCLLNEKSVLDVYLDELPTILYHYDSKGRMAIESKDEYKRRTGRSSPDYADSLALANYGRYDEIGVGRMTSDYSNQGFAKPFASSLRGEKTW